ncbi:MAG: FtsW/RodA/SpoVE family cell cycle protein [Tepidisphaeraceae bacterium]|jgi:cell division protein FtsW (lipid II flippase)
MNRIWRQLAIASNWPILVAVLVLASIGVVSIQAHSVADPHAAADAQKQMLFIAIGFGVMLAMQAVSYLAIGRFAWPFYILSLASLVYTVLPGMPTGAFLGVPEIKGQRNWINAGPVKFQPAELMKVAFCMVMARYLRFRSNYRTLGGLIPPFLLAVVPLMVILKQPDLGTAILFIPALFAMLFVAGARLQHLFAVMGIGLALMPIAWYSGPREKTGLDIEVPVLKHFPAMVKKYQRARVYALFSRDPAILRDTGYQQEQAVTAFGSGGFSGKGALNIPVGRTVPEAHNDMVFALIGEQFGFIGATVTLAAYLVFFTTGVEIASATREPFGKLVAVGTVSLLAGQTFCNIMVAQRLMPVTGITLPFVSYGGSSLLASFIAAGLLLNIGQNRPLVMANDAFEFD